MEKRKLAITMLVTTLVAKAVDKTTLENGMLRAQQ
jgi:hypothetical protein